MSAEDQRQPPAVGVEPATEEEASGCCADAAAGEQTDAAATLSMFQNFMKEANRPGRIDQRVKKLMAVALSISQRCEPCLKIHMKSALSMGITREELDEAANLATAFGGCTAMMFYEQIGQQFQD